MAMTDAASGGPAAFAAASRHFSSWSPSDAFGLTEGSEPLLAELAAVALEAAQAAGRILVRGDEISGVETKISTTDMVSDVDLASEAAVTAILSRRRPDDSVLGEEGTTRIGTSGVRWVVDPLDGTTNFLFGIPQFAVSIAAEMDGQPV